MQGVRGRQFLAEKRLRACNLWFFLGLLTASCALGEILGPAALSSTSSCWRNAAHQNLSTTELQISLHAAVLLTLLAIVLSSWRLDHAAGSTVQHSAYIHPSGAELLLTCAHMQHHQLKCMASS
jgi:hypothetical protein